MSQRERDRLKALEQVQWDTREHAWLEERGPEKMCLVALIDDASGHLFARFVEADSTEENMRVLQQYLRTHGRPQAVYTDKRVCSGPRWRGVGRPASQPSMANRNWDGRCVSSASS